MTPVRTEPVEGLRQAQPERHQLRFAMVAGEASGDLLAGLLLDGLNARWPGLQAQGIGGSQMASRGFEAWWPQEKLAVRGYVEVLRQYREIVGIRSQLKARLLRDPPAAFIGVDAPDFNLDLEAALKARGIRTIQFVCPSIWAWRAGRLGQLRRSADHVLCIFPFEPALLAPHGIAATYVGHPLARMIPLAANKIGARQLLGLPVEQDVVAILPGSRASELDFLGSRFMQAAMQIQHARPATQFVVPTLPGLRPTVEQLAQRAGFNANLKVLTGQSHLALEACDVALVASGTATLEAALFKRPMVIAYRMNGLTFQIMKRKQLQPWIGLPNILCREFVVPELIQQEASPAALASAVLDWFAAPARMVAVQRKFHALHVDLTRDTATLASDAIEKVIRS